MTADEGKPTQTKRVGRKFQEQFRNEDIDEDEVVGLLSNRAKKREERQLHDVRAPVNKGKTGSGGMPAYKGLRKRD